MDHFFARYINHADRAIIGCREKFAVIVDKAEFSYKFVMRTEAKDRLLFSARLISIDDIDASVIVASCDEPSFLGLGKGSQKDLSNFYFFDSLFRSAIVKVDSTIVSPSYNRVIDGLDLPVFHNLAFYGA